MTCQTISFYKSWYDVKKYFYYTSRELPIQNVHRQPTDILKYHPLLQQRRILSRCLVLSLTSSTFFDVICLTERHDQFEHSNCAKEHFCERCIFIHAYLKEAVHYFPFGTPLTMVGLRR